MQTGTMRSAQIQAPAGIRISMPLSSSMFAPDPGGGVVEVMVEVIAKYPGVGLSTGVQGLGVQEPSSPQQYSVLPEQSVLHITGMFAGQRPRPM
mmetsp:Transcript_36991/g.105220  ORF Transcript_36991/g.105220 Transcript_36991/m.105220 type:complete len:94 (-) Transcript_36991:904-1185(-)